MLVIQGGDSLLKIGMKQAQIMKNKKAKTQTRESDPRREEFAKRMDEWTNLSDSSGTAPTIDIDSVKFIPKKK